VEKEILEQIREEMERAYRPPGLSKGSEPAQATRELLPAESAGQRSALAALYGSYALVGQMPPEPPTFRGRLGARLIKVVQRLLSWYTPQIVHFQYSALQAFEEQAKNLERLDSSLRDLRRRQEVERKAEEAERKAVELRVRQVEAELAEAIATKSARIEALERRLDDGLAARDAVSESLTAQWDAMRAQVMPRIERELLRVRSQQIAQERRISLLLEEARKRWPQPFDVAQIERLCAEERHNLDAFYTMLEDEFRGSREEIEERLSVYLPKLAEAGVGNDGMPILDVGCGRGEWLELLRKSHLQASGVDLNRVNVAMCQEHGLAVVEADAVDYLRGIPEGSLGAVTAFHLIEHLPLARLLDLLDAIVRALKPGGIAIFETPNPNNILVSSRYFYLDPTHRHPIPPQLGQFLAEARGLRRIAIQELHPWPEAHHVDTRTGGEVAGRFNECFYGPQDYAIIGWKV
jgi:2-polyprenyl-3-methyl-5-hydroxy-6-metoxy-1,4-benzoquinol methylase